jgi:hypothetical protein
MQAPKRERSYSFLTSTLDGGEWSATRPAALYPRGKVQETGWAPEPVWTQRPEEKFSRLCRGPNFDRPVVQSVARHYTDWAGNSQAFLLHNIARGMRRKWDIIYVFTATRPFKPDVTLCSISLLYECSLCLQPYEADAYFVTPHQDNKKV